MIKSTQNTIAALIAHYGLELEGSQVDTVVVPWLDRYEPSWIVKAIVESLYRGRYKVNSVDRILQDWERIGKPRYWFSSEYERGILEKLPEIVAMGFPGVISPIDRSSRQNLGMSPPIFISADDPSPHIAPVEDSPSGAISGRDTDRQTSGELGESSSNLSVELDNDSDPNEPATPSPAHLPASSQLLITLTAIIEPNRPQFIADSSTPDDRADTN